MLFLSFVQYKYVDSGHAKAGNGAWGGLCGYCVALHFWRGLFRGQTVLDVLSLARYCSVMIYDGCQPEFLDCVGLGKHLASYIVISFPHIYLEHMFAPLDWQCNQAHLPATSKATQA